VIWNLSQLISDNMEESVSGVKLAIKIYGDAEEPQSCAPRTWLMIDDLASLRLEPLQIVSVRGRGLGSTVEEAIARVNRRVTLPRRYHFD